MRSGSESDSDPFTGWVTAASLVDESPEAIADLILSSLTPQDRVLLQRQAELAAEAAQAPAALAASSSGGSRSGGGSSGSSSSGSSAVHTSQNVQRIQQVVDHLIATASTELQRKAAAERQAQQQENQQQGEQQRGEQQQAQQPEEEEVQRQEPGEVQQQEWLEQLEDLTSSGAAGRMAAGSLGWRAGESVLGGAAGAAGAAGEPSGSGAKGGTAHTVTQLMGLFKASPLFRGGPMPGVQVLHRRCVLLPPLWLGGTDVVLPQPPSCWLHRCCAHAQPRTLPHASCLQAGWLASHHCGAAFSAIPLYCPPFEQAQAGRHAGAAPLGLRRRCSRGSRGHRHCSGGCCSRGRAARRRSPGGRPVCGS